MMTKDNQALRDKIHFSAENWRERCPLRITTLAKYISDTFGDKVVVDLQDWSVTKGRQFKNGVYWSRGTYDGKRLRVSIVDEKNLAYSPDRYRYCLRAKDGKHYETIIDHNTAETYRKNQEVCEKIVAIEKYFAGK